MNSGSEKCTKCEKTVYPTEAVSIDGTAYHKKCFKCSHCNMRLALTGYAMINGNPYCKPHFKQLFQTSGGKYDRAFGSQFNNSADPVVQARAADWQPSSTPSTPKKHRRQRSGSVGDLPLLKDITQAMAVSVAPATPLSPTDSGVKSEKLVSPQMVPKAGAAAAAQKTPRHQRRRSSFDASTAPSQTHCAYCGKTVYPMDRLAVDKGVFHKRCFKCKHCNCKLTMSSFAMIEGTSYCRTHFKQLFQSSGGKYDRAFGSKFSNSSDPVVIAAQAAEAERKDAMRSASTRIEPTSPKSGRLAKTPQRSVTADGTKMPASSKTPTAVPQKIKMPALAPVIETSSAPFSSPVKASSPATSTPKSTPVRSPKLPAAVSKPSTPKTVANGTPKSSSSTPTVASKPSTPKSVSKPSTPKSVAKPSTPKSAVAATTPTSRPDRQGSLFKSALEASSVLKSPTTNKEAAAELSRNLTLEKPKFLMARPSIPGPIRPPPGGRKPGGAQAQALNTGHKAEPVVEAARDLKTSNKQAPVSESKSKSHHEKDVEYEYFSDSEADVVDDSDSDYEVVYETVSEGSDDSEEDVEYIEESEEEEVEDVYEEEEEEVLEEEEVFEDEDEVSSEDSAEDSEDSLVDDEEEVRRAEEQLKLAQSTLARTAFAKEMLTTKGSKKNARPEMGADFFQQPSSPSRSKSKVPAKKPSTPKPTKQQPNSPKQPTTPKPEKAADAADKKAANGALERPRWSMALPSMKAAAKQQQDSAAPTTNAAGEKLSKPTHSRNASKTPQGRSRRSSRAKPKSPYPTCPKCEKLVYPTEGVTAGISTYHKKCFKCEQCKTRLTPLSSSMLNGVPYCKPHFSQLFQRNGGKYDFTRVSSASISGRPSIGGRTSTPEKQLSIKDRIKLQQQRIAESGPEDAKAAAAGNALQNAIAETRAKRIQQEERIKAKREAAEARRLAEAEDAKRRKEAEAEAAALEAEAEAEAAAAAEAEAAEIAALEAAARARAAELAAERERNAAEALDAQSSASPSTPIDDVDRLIELARQQELRASEESAAAAAAAAGMSSVPEEEEPGVLQTNPKKPRRGKSKKRIHEVHKPSKPKPKRKTAVPPTGAKPKPKPRSPKPTRKVPESPKPNRKALESPKPNRKVPHPDDDAGAAAGAEAKPKPTPRPKTGSRPLRRPTQKSIERRMTEEENAFQPISKKWSTAEGVAAAVQQEDVNILDMFFEEDTVGVSAAGFKLTDEQRKKVEQKMREKDVARSNKKKKQQQVARSPSKNLRSPSRKIRRPSNLSGDSDAGGEYIGEDGLPRTRHKRVRSRVIVNKKTGERKKQVAVRKKVREDESLELMTIVTSGAEMWKHGRRGKPHKRNVYVDFLEAQQPRISWEKDSIQLSDVIKVVTGKCTPVFLRNASRGAPSGHCFSLIGRKRTLDLQTRDEETRDKWVRAFEVCFQIKLSTRQG